MNLDLNDPKWTAYAFDELDVGERAAVEAQLAANPAARQLVEELQKTGALLKTALTSEPVARLTAEQRATLAAAVSDQPAASGSPSVALASPSPGGRIRRRWVAVLGVVAASGLIVAVLLPARQGARKTASVARSDAAKTAADNHSGMLLSQSGAARVDGREGDHTRRPESSVSLDGETQSAGNPSDPYGSSASIVVDNSLSLSPQSTNGGDASGRFRFRADLGNSVQDSTTYTFNQSSGTKQGYSRPADDRDKKTEAGGLIGPVQIEFLEGLDQIVIRGHPREVERVTEIVRELEAKTEPGPLVGDFAAAREPVPMKGKEAEVTKLLTELRQIQERNQASANEPTSGEAYDLPPENPFEPVASNPLSTFSIDVDTASYANIRRFLMQNNQLPPPAAVRIEEMINYFRYDYRQPEGDVPFSVTTEVATCPWNTDHRLVRVGLKGKEIARDKRPVSNLVFLLDVSGSMQDPNKLPLVRESMKLLVRELSENDRVAIVVYAGASGLVLDSTTGDQKDLIIGAIDQLQAGGSTNGAGGLQQAYDVAAAPTA
jgi:hypothetical protein